MTLRSSRRNRPEAVPPPPPPSLLHTAQDQLARAAALKATDETITMEERSVWRPASWMLQNCWEVLADAGAGPEAVAVAQLAAERQPVALQEALYKLARQAAGKPALVALLEQTLARQAGTLLRAPILKPSPHHPQQLLFCAAAAAHLGDSALALTYLETLDQTDRAWERILAAAEQRTVLAETLVRVGPHPLVLTLLDQALRRHTDGGAELLLRVCEQIDPVLGANGAAAGENAPAAFVPDAFAPDTFGSDAFGSAPPENKQARLLRHCVDAFRYGMLTTLQSHRIAAAVYARAGRWSDVLQEVTTIANIQEGQRMGGSLRQGDQNVLRQVKRPQADPGVDFQVYTLREAIRAVPLRLIPRETRVELARTLAELGTRSDGWTAAGAASTLAELGALKLAAEVVARIAPTDPTRSEGTIALVRGLLAVGDMATADQHAQKALDWARSQSGRNPERALTWGLVDAYLEFGHPDRALALIEQWRDDAGFFSRLRSRLSPQMSDDELRLKRLRLQALLDLSQGQPARKEEIALVQELSAWAPRLLEGDALIDFYADGLLRPLLAAGHTEAAYALLPAIQAALSTSTGDKHATRVRQVAALLARQVRLAAASDAPLDADAESQSVFGRFVADLWEADGARGIWQIVHGIDGSLPLVLALEGPGTVVGIARFAHEQGDDWS